jgi:cell division protein FtsI (penicillin-binding protein 3)
MKSRKVIIQESTGRRIIEQGRVRLWCVGLFFLLCFISISWRMIEVAVIDNKHALTITVTDPDTNEESEEVTAQSTEPVLRRGDIVDRNGMLLATSLMTASLFANTKEIKNPEETAAKLEKTLGVDGKKILAGLKSGKSFLWVKRNLTPKEEQAVNSLGIPGLYFQPEEKRVYPYGNLFAHTVGYVGLDNQGLAGIEKQLDQRLRDEALNRQSLKLSLDARLQGIMREEVMKAVTEFHAIGATGVIMDLHSGELLSMVSLPDFDPNHPGKADDNSRFNRASLGVYEMGSTFKSFTMAMALNYGTANMKSSYDTTGPLHIGGFTVHDDEPKNRWLAVPEIYAYSSNVGAARMALEVGGKRQKMFLEKLGMMKPVDIELPEKGSPLYPAEWREISSVTIAYGHGMSVSPLHLVRGVAALVDGGILPHLTLIKDGNKDRVVSERVITEQTSKNMRRLMRLVVDHGTGGRANVPGYRVAGKTGTAEKVSGGVYEHNAKLTSFIATFPMDNPQYIVLVMVDNPKGNKSTFNFATGGWISAPVVGRVISRMGPLYGIVPQFDTPEDDAEKFWVDNKENKDAPPAKPASHPASLPAALKKYLHAASY